MDFLKILKTITKDTSLTRTDICVMAVITTYAQYEPDKTIEMSTAEIHEEFESIPQRTIQRSVKHLAELHYISIIKQAPPKPNKYKVLIDIGQPQAKPWRSKKPKDNNDFDVSKYAQFINKI